MAGCLYREHKTSLHVLPSTLRGRHHHFFASRLNQDSLRYQRRKETSDRNISSSRGRCSREQCFILQCLCQECKRLSRSISISKCRVSGWATVNRNSKATCWEHNTCTREQNPDLWPLWLGRLIGIQRNYLWRILFFRLVLRPVLPCCSLFSFITIWIVITITIVAIVVAVVIIIPMVG